MFIDGILKFKRLEGQHSTKKYDGYFPYSQINGDTLELNGAKCTIGEAARYGKNSPDPYTSICVVYSHYFQSRPSYNIWNFTVAYMTLKLIKLAVKNDDVCEACGEMMLEAEHFVYKTNYFDDDEKDFFRETSKIEKFRNVTYDDYGRVKVTKMRGVK